MDRDSVFMEGEPDVLGTMPDYHKMNLADVDVIERTTTKCQPRHPTKVRTYKCNSDYKGNTDTNSEESEELYFQHFDVLEEDATTDEVSPESQILMGLDSLLKRIEIMQCDIRLRQQLEGNIESQSEEQEALQPDEDTDTDECHGVTLQLLEIRELQRAQHRLQCEITELLCRYDKLRTRKRVLSYHWNLVMEKTAEISMLSQENQQWMLDTAHELANCRKRSRTIRAGKLTKQLAEEVTETNIWSSFRYSRRYLLCKLFGSHIEDMRSEITELKQYSHDLASEIDLRLANIHEKATDMGRLIAITGRQPKTVPDSPPKRQSILKQNPKYTEKNSKKKT